MAVTTQGPLIAFLITGDARRNSRAIRQIRALRAAGFRVHLATTRTDGNHPLPSISTTVHEIEEPTRSGPAYFWQWHRRLSAHVETIDADIYHASDLYALPAAVRAARRRQAPSTYDARELYSHVASTVGRPWVSYFWRRLEMTYAVQCDAVFTVSPSIASYLSSTYNVSTPVVVENVPETRKVEQTTDGIETLRRVVGLQHDERIVLHQGQIREHRGCEVLVRAIPMTRDNTHVVFLGDGPLRDLLRTLALELGVANRVHFLDPVPPDELLSLTQGADVGATLLEDVCLNHRLALPNKLFEYLAAGVPVIGSDLPEIRRILHGFDVGVVCRPGDPKSTSEKLNYALDNPDVSSKWRANCHRVFETINWESASHRFTEAFQSLVTV